MHGVKIDEVRYGPSTGNRKTPHVATTPEEPVAAGGHILNAEDAEYLESLAARKQAWAISDKEPVTEQNDDHRPQTGRREENNSTPGAKTKIKHQMNRNAIKTGNDGSAGAAASVSMEERYAAAEAAVAQAEAAQKKAADHERTLKAKEARLTKMKVRS